MSLTCTISGVSVDVQSISRPDRIDQKTICTITVIDLAGTALYQRGQPIVITDSILGTIFTGYVHNPTSVKLYPNPGLLWSLDCIQAGDYLAGKRTSNKTYNNQYTGTVVVDQIQRYGAAEGLRANAALRWDELQSDWAAGTLSGTVATTNASDGNPGDGDLELSLAGAEQTISFQTTADFSGGTLSNVTAANNTLMPTSTPAIKIQGTQSLAGAGNTYTYFKIWQGSQAITQQSYLAYDLWVDPSSPEIKIGVDIVCSDGTTLRDAANFGTYYDGQYQPPHPNTDLNGLANTGQWYHRFFPLPWASGKTISYVTVAIEGDSKGVYTGWIKNIFFQTFNGVGNFYFFQNTLQTAQQMQNNGYSNVSVSVVPTYAIPFYTPIPEGSNVPNACFQNAAGVSVSGVGILKSSYLAYKANLPAGTMLICKYSFDNSIFYVCSNNAPLPNALAGTNLTGKSLYLNFQFWLDPSVSSFPSPEVAPVLSSVRCVLNPSYAATKSDVAFLCAAQADWTQAGTTLTNVAANSKILTLNGFTRNWDDGSLGGQTLYTGNAQQFVDDKTFIANVTASYDARSRMDFAGQWQNFTCEVDILVNANADNGLVYRTTGWQNGANTFGYTVTINPTTLIFGHGNNSASGSGAWQLLNSVTISLKAGQWYRLKVVVNGTNHQVFINDILFLNATDSTFTAAGYIGLRTYNGSTSAQTGQFDNFGVMATLSGTWVSPAISLAAASAYGNSLLSYRDQRQDSTNCSIKVESSLDGGTTWSTYSNATQGTTADPLQGLTAGQSLTSTSIKFRITLTTTTATSMPGIDNFRMLVLGAFSSSGTRISSALSLAGVGTAGSTLVSWNDNVPPHTSVAVATSLDSSTWTSITNGGSIPGITTQGDPIEDTFSTNTSANYTSTFEDGGSLATWTWDTAHRRVVATDGSLADLLLNGFTAKDVDIIFDMDYSVAGGIVWRFQDASTFYKVLIADSANGNYISIYRVVGDGETTLANTTPGVFNFTQGTYQRFRLTMIGSVITLYQNGTQILSTTDSNITTAGKVGLRNGDIGISRYYSLRAQAMGQSLAGVSAYTRVTLTSTDPTVTPQMLDMQTFVSSPDIAPGILMPSVDYRRTFLDANIADANNQSDYWTSFRNDKSILFQPRIATPAPLVLSSLNSQVIAGQVINDVLVDGAELDNSGDSYRNRMIMKNAIATSTYTEIKTGDGSATSWDVANPLAAPPDAITLNGQLVTFGVQGVDTGKQYYYQIGSTTITQDSSQGVLQGTDALKIEYLGSSSKDVVLDNTSMPGTITQSMMATIENAAGGSSSGIVEAVYDASALTVDAATTLGNQLLQRYGNIGRTFKCKTLRSGFAPGQQVSLFVPEFNLNNVQMLIVEVNVAVAQAPGVTGGLLYTWSLTMMEGPNLGSWVQLFINAFS